VEPGLGGTLVASARQAGISLNRWIVRALERAVLG